MIKIVGRQFVVVVVVGGGEWFSFSTYHLNASRSRSRRVECEVSFDSSYAAITSPMRISFDSTAKLLTLCVRVFEQHKVDDLAINQCMLLNQKTFENWINRLAGQWEIKNQQQIHRRDEKKNSQNWSNAKQIRFDKHRDEKKPKCLIF